MSEINFKDYIGKTISDKTLKKYDFYHYINGECQEYAKMMKKEYEDYDESLIKDEIPDDCWLTRVYIPEGSCLETNGVLIFELDDNNVIENISYMVEYVHNPGEHVSYMDIEENVGNFYGYQDLNTPYMIEDDFKKIMRSVK